MRHEVESAQTYTDGPVPLSTALLAGLRNVPRMLDCPEEAQVGVYPLLKSEQPSQRTHPWLSPDGFL